MSPLLKNHYTNKYRRSAFYIVANDELNRETPPQAAAMICVEYSPKAMKKNLTPTMPKEYEDMIIPLRTWGKKNERIRDNPEILRKNPRIRCPDIPNQWEENIRSRTKMIYLH